MIFLGTPLQHGTYISYKDSTFCEKFVIFVANNSHKAYDF